MGLQQITITKFNDARNIICFTIKILQSNVPILSTRKIIIYKIYYYYVVDVYTNDKSYSLAH